MPSQLTAALQLAAALPLTAALPHMHDLAAWPARRRDCHDRCSQHTAVRAHQRRDQQKPIQLAATLQLAAALHTAQRSTA